MILRLAASFLLQDPQEHQGAAHAAGEQQEETIANYILHHIHDSNTLELPFVGEVHLPHLELFGFDISITKHVVMMWVVAALLLIFLPKIARSRKSGGKNRGINFVEAIVVFIREDILKNYLGHEGKRFEPYLLTAFFFVLLCNLLGAVPYGATATGNIAVTGAMALLTFLVVQISGIRHHGFVGYFKGLVPGGLPIFLWPLMFVVELMGLVTKHFSLAIRLFANMTAGHVVIFALLGLIFFVAKSFVIAPLPLIGAVAISLLEVLVAFLQAYIFTLLSAVFIGAAVHQEH
jgi:F-type H+-transporting ATPase subunit a